MSDSIGRASLWRIDAGALLLALAAAAATYFLGVAPAVRARAQERAKQEALGPQEELRNQSVLALQQAVKRLDAAHQELDASPLRLEPVSQVNHRLVRITELAADTGLGLDQMTPGAQTPSEDAVVVELRLTGRGDFPESLLFLARLHSDFADMAVTGFRLSGNSGAPGARGTFAFDLAWYAASETLGSDRRADVPLP